MSDAGTAAVSCVALIYVVGSGLPFQSTIAPETKDEPLTVRVKAAEPAVAALGLMEVIVGTGLETAPVRAELWTR
jgi:hypothetical protein